MVAKTRQSGSELGRSLRTMMVRTTNASKAAYVGGEVTNDDISNAEASLRRVGIEVRKDKDSFKEFDEIIGEIYSKLDGLSQLQLSDIAYNVASTRQTSQFKMMVKSYGDYMNMAEQANDATNTTIENQEKYADSLKGHLGELSAVGQSTWNNVLNSNELKGGVDLLTKIVTIVDKLTSAVGSLGTLSLGVGLFASLKKGGIFTVANNELSIFGKTLTNIKNNLSSGQGLSSIFSSAISTSDIKATTQYTSLIKQGVPTGKAWAQTMTSASVAAKQNVVACKNNVVALEEMTAAQNANTVASKTGATALKGLAIAGNMLVFLVIAQGISLASKAIDEYVHYNDIAIDKADELKSAIDSSVSAINQHQDSLNSLKDRFLELSKGVDEYGNNISLTDKQMEEYHGLVKDLIDINPSLIQGYDSENQAIIDKNTALAETVRLLEREKQLELEKATSSSNLKTVGEGASAKKRKLTGTDIIGQFQDYDLDSLSGQAARFGEEAAKVFNDESIKAFYDYTNSRPNEKMYGKSVWLKVFGFDISEDNMDLDLASYLQQNANIFANNMDDILKNANIDPTSKEATSLKLYIQEWETLNEELKAIDTSYIDEYIQKIPQLVDGYDSMTDAQKSFIGEYIRNNFSSYDLENDSVKVKSSIIDMVKSVSSDKEIQNEIDQLFALNGKGLKVEDYTKQYKAIIENIISKLNLSDSDATKLRFSLSVDADDLETKYNNAITSAKEKFGKDETNFFNANSINTKEEIDRWLEIAQGAKNATEAERKYVEESQKVEVPLSKTEVIENVNALSEGFESLDKIMKSMSDKDNPFDYALLDDSKFKEAFGDYKEEYANFIETISNSPKDVEGAQSAFNDLATALIDGKLAIGGYTEENAKLIASMLRNMGVTNAEEVVTTRLTSAQEHLAAQKAYTTEVSNDLTNATANEIPNIIDEATQSDIARVAIAGMALAKMDANGTTLDTSGDIENVESLIGIIGTASDAIRAFKNGEFYDSEEQKTNRDKLFSETTGLGLTNQIDKDLKDYDERVKKAKEAANKQVQDAIKTAADYSGKGSQVNANYGGVGANKSSGSGGSGSGSSKKETKEKFDWIAVGAKETQEELDKFKDSLDEIDSWKPKNKATDELLTGMSSQLAELQKQADAYQTEANKYAENLNSTYIDKIQNGSLEIEEITDELVASNVKGYQEMYEKAEDFKNKIDDVKKSMKELAQSKLDNIIKDFDSLISLMDARSSSAKSYLELQKELGEEINSYDYSDLINQQEDTYNQLQKKYSTLERELSKAVSAGTIKYGDDAWNKYNKELIDVNDSMNDIVSKMNEFRQAMINLPFDEMGKFNDELDRMNDGYNTLSDLLGDGGLTDNGAITSKGLAKIAILGKQYTNAKQQVANYAEEIRALEEAYSDGTLTQDEYNDKLSEFTSKQNSAVQAIKQAQDAIVEFRKTAIQEQIDDYNKLIEAKKKAMQEDKTYADYLDEVAEKQKNISTLQAKIDELSTKSDASDRSAIAMRLQLEDDLTTAKKDLAKTQADYAYDQTLNSLDKQAEEYANAKDKELDELESSYDAQQKVVEDYLGQVKDNYKTVYNTLTQYGENYNISATEDLVSPWESAGSAVDAFQSAMSDAIAQINIDLASIDLSSLTELVSTMNGFSGGGSSSGGFEDITGTGTWRKTSKGYWYGSSNDDYASDGIYTIGGKQYSFNEDGYMKTGWNDDSGDWRYFEPENGQMVKSAWRKDKKGKEYYLKSDGTMATDMAVKAKSGNGYYYVDDDGVWDGKTLSYDDVKKKNITVGYKSGTLSSKPGLKWVDEESPELIRTPDGTLLRSAGDDVIFNADRTKSLYDMSYDPAKYIMDTVAKNSNDLGSIAGIKQFNPVTMKITSPLVVVEGNADQKTLAEIDSRLYRFAKQELPNIIQQDLRGR